MIKYFKDLYYDWIQYRMIRRNLNVLDPKKNEDLIKYLVNRYKEEDEDKIISLMLHNLTNELVRDNINPDNYRWYVMALEHRMMLFRNNRKLLNKKP